MSGGASVAGMWWIDLLHSLWPYPWFVLVMVLLIVYRHQVRELFQRVRGVKALGVELAFAEASLEKAAVEGARSMDAKALEQGTKTSGRPLEVPEKDRKRALDRARQNLDLLAGRSILWVDDVPTNNRNERRMFRGLGVASEAVVSTEEAIARLERDESQFDVVLSDMLRDGDPAAGLKLIDRYDTLSGGAADRLPVILYIWDYDPKLGTPPGAFGITNRPDTLVHLVIDALSRTP
ncbi:MAG: response regulator [Pseudomonadota bacterium]